MSIRDLMADICDALNDNPKCRIYVEDGVYEHPTKDVFVSIYADTSAMFSPAQVSAINPKSCTSVEYIAYVFSVSLKKYGYEVNNINIKHKYNEQVCSSILAG